MTDYHNLYKLYDVLLLADILETVTDMVKITIAIKYQVTVLALDWHIYI